MRDLSPRDLELVALGAAMGSNCPPCMEYHIPQSRKVGLSDAEIHAAILHADKIRQVPARKTLQTALAMLPAVALEAGSAESMPGCGCVQDDNAPSAAASSMAQPAGGMAAMMSKMMASCGTLAPSACLAHPSGEKEAGKPAANATGACC